MPPLNSGMPQLTHGSRCTKPSWFNGLHGLMGHCRINADITGIENSMGSMGLNGKAVKAQGAQPALNAQWAQGGSMGIQGIDNSKWAQVVQ